MQGRGRLGQSADEQSAAAAVGIPAKAAAASTEKEAAEQACPASPRQQAVSKTHSLCSFQWQLHWHCLRTDLTLPILLLVRAFQSICNSLPGIWMKAIIL